MKILHYNLGLPPYRTGGLTKYSVDLMTKQVESSHKVSLLYPGHFKLSKKTSIKSNKEFHGVKIYEIVNPLPVSLLGGIVDPVKYKKNVYPEDVYIQFLLNEKPDIIHVHTLMGIHRDFFLAAKKLNIKMVFTTHDYFGICPKVNLIDYCGKNCCGNNEGKKCVTCNQNAYSLTLIYIMQSKAYRSFKNNTLIKKIRKIKKKSIIMEESSFAQKQEDFERANQFNELIHYYLSILQLIDCFHFNSKNTQQEYEKYLPVLGKVIPITHNDIKDNRRIRKYQKDEPLKITYLGPIDRYKGFTLLHQSLNQLLVSGRKKWELNVYGNSYGYDLNENEENYIHFNGKYQYKDMGSIFDHTDLLVLPSIWKETFGFVALEALSYGVPILISSCVGCKDIVEDGKVGLVFKPEINELASMLEKIIENRSILENINLQICNGDFHYTMDDHMKNIELFYQEVIGGWK